MSTGPGLPQRVTKHPSYPSHGLMEKQLELVHLFSSLLWLPPVGLHVKDCASLHLAELDEEGWDNLLQSPPIAAFGGT